MLLCVTALAGCTGKKGGSGGEKGGGGTPAGPDTLLFGAEQEPPALNNWTNAGNTVWTGIVTTPVLHSLSIYKPDFTYEPQLLAKLPELKSTTPQVVHYELRPEAAWDDGTKITADDVQATLDAVLDDKNDIVSRIGYDKIKDGKLSNVSADKKAFDIEFTEPYAPWRDLFTASNQPLLQAKALKGKKFNSFMNAKIGFASGPFKFEKWAKGEELVLVRNEKYWGEKAKLKRIVFKFIPDTGTQLEALEAGEVQAIYPQPQVEILDDLKKISDAKNTVRFGPLWEHIDFNTTVAGLDDTLVRQALAYMVDREAVVERIAKPLNEDATPLQSVIYVNNQKEYQAAGWTDYTQDYDKASQLLTEAGYTKGSGGTWEKGGKKLSFKISTTSDNKARELTEEILIEQWKKGGVQVTVDNSPADQLFERIPNCEYEIALFAYQGAPDPSGANSIYRDDMITCPKLGAVEGGQNSTAYRNATVTAKLKETDVLLDAVARTALYNEVNVLISKDAPTLPMYQKANLLAWNEAVSGMEDNPTVQGPSWNAEQWEIAGS